MIPTLVIFCSSRLTPRFRWDPRKALFIPRRGAGRSIASGPLTNASIFPEALEPIRRQRGIAHRGRDRSVPEVVLDSPRVMSVVSQLVATRVPQYVAADQEPKACCHPGAGDHALIAGHAERC